MSTLIILTMVFSDFFTCKLNYSEASTCFYLNLCLEFEYPIYLIFNSDTFIAYIYLLEHYYMESSFLSPEYLFIPLFVDL